MHIAAVTEFLQAIGTKRVRMEGIKTLVKKRFLAPQYCMTRDAGI